MTALEIVYGGHTYHLSGRTLDEVQQQIASAATDGWSWLEVIDGGGPAHLLVSAGVTLAIIPIPASEQ